MGKILVQHEKQMFDIAVSKYFAGKRLKKGFIKNLRDVD